MDYVMLDKDKPAETEPTTPATESTETTAATEPVTTEPADTTP